MSSYHDYHMEEEVYEDLVEEEEELLFDLGEGSIRALPQRLAKLD